MATDRQLSPQHGAHIPRRALLRGAGGGVVAATWLVACGDDDTASSTTAESDTETSAPSDDAASGDTKTVTVSDVAVGGGVVVEETYVVTQPTDGDFKGFTAICTHKQCPVGEVTDGEIICPCHGSRFSIEDGAVVNGPATEPLAEAPVSVDGDTITVG